MKLVVSRSRLRIRDVIRAEEGFKTTAEVVDFLARFAQDDSGAYLEHDAAIERLYDLSLEELGPLADEFTRQVKATAGSPLAQTTTGG